MSSSKDFFVSRWVRWFLANAVMIAVIILAGMALRSYTKYGINTYSTAYNSKVFLCCCLAIAFAALSILLDLIPSSAMALFVKVSRAICYLLLLYAALQYVLTQVDFIGAVYANIDLEKFQPLIPGFVETTVNLLVPSVLALAGTCLTRWCLGDLCKGGGVA